MSVNHQEIINENNRRRAKLFAPYDPLTGEGSPFDRVPIRFIANGEQWYFNAPVEMYNDFKEFFDELMTLGSVEAVLKANKQTVSNESIHTFLKGITAIRFRYDFEFWAFTTVIIEDRESSQEIPFKLRQPQRKTLVLLETMRKAGVPIRIIICKARQWGGSTLIQIYMAWMQIVQLKNWHSAVIADIEDQATNIRGMYSRLAKLYPKIAGSVTFRPYEKSSKNRIIKERGCIVGVGSAQEPDNLRSYKFQMLHMCLSPGSMIPVKDGFVKKVENLAVGDQIITHNGNVSKITSITESLPSKYNGDGIAVNIRPWMGHDIIVTPNHPIYTKRGWIAAGELTIHDHVSMPIRNITNEINHITLPYFPMRKHGGGKQPSHNGGKIEINKEFGFALGYYLAEGSIHRTEIIFTRHDNESEYGNRAVKAISHYLSSHSQTKRKNTFTTIEHCYGAALAKWIYNELGSKDYKRVPDWFFNCGNEFLLGVLQGYLSGDGSKTNGKQNTIEIASISATTISSSIATQIRDIAASLGLGWAAIDIKKAGFIHGRNCQECFIVRWNGISARRIREVLNQYYPKNGQVRSEKTEIDGNRVWIKIKSISKSIVSKVYDIEVDHSDHSFRTLYFSVKNSEVGLWKTTPQKSAKDLVQSVRATVPQVPNSLIALESTAKGVGSFFHGEWLDAKAGKTSYRPLFVAWWEIEIYQKEIENYTAFIDWVFKVNNKYATFLWELGATLEGIKWYFDFKLGENYDDWRMKSEYPSTDVEAFQATGAMVFHQDYVINARKGNRDPEFIGDIEPKGIKEKEAFENIQFKEDDKGDLRIWCMPDHTIQVSNRYEVIVDIGGRTHKADWSVIKVFDRYWMMEGGKPEVAAVWVGHIDQDLVAWKAAQIAHWYNKAILVVEVNSLKKDTETSEGGHHLTVLDEIAGFYSNIYARMDPERIRQNLPIKYGFHTNVSTKPMIIDQMNGYLRDEAYYERDGRCCDEMTTYEVKQDGSYGAVEGCHDDHVITTAIGLWICFKYLPMPAEIVQSTTKSGTRIISEASI